MPAFLFATADALNSGSSAGLVSYRPDSPSISRRRLDSTRPHHGRVIHLSPADNMTESLHLRLHPLIVFLKTQNILHHSRGFIVCICFFLQYRECIYFSRISSAKGYQPLNPSSVSTIFHQVSKVNRALLPSSVSIHADSRACPRHK